MEKKVLVQRLKTSQGTVTTEDADICDNAEKCIKLFHKRWNRDYGITYI